MYENNDEKHDEADETGHDYEKTRRANETKAGCL